MRCPRDFAVQTNQVRREGLEYQKHLLDSEPPDWEDLAFVEKAL